MAKRKSPKQRKEERQQEKRRGQQTILIGAVILVAIFAAVVFALSSVPAEAPIPDGIDQFDEFMQSTTDEGYALLGNPDAPVEVVEYSSFSCVGCLDFHSSVFPLLLEYIRDGRINFTFVPLQTGSVPNPGGAARTAICAGEQGQFWQMHEVLFSWHEIYVNSAFQDGRIRTGVKNMGLDTGEFNSCFNSNATDAVLNAARAEGVASTPSVFVNNAPVTASFDAIVAAIESNLTGQAEFAPGTVDGVVDDADTEETEDTTEDSDTTEDTDTSEDTDAGDAEDTTEDSDTSENTDADDAEDTTEDSDTSEDADAEATEEASDD